MPSIELKDSLIEKRKKNIKYYIEDLKNKKSSKILTEMMTGFDSK
mgnify:CR=1 FL=1|tara:strand:+ start:1742 stop:1876 length:135 start_codon:yes stop_codon:yes gene_type:complete